MNDPYPTQFLTVPSAHDPRAQPLDDTWLLTISTVALAIAMPWFLSGVSIDFSAAALGLLALAAIQVAFAGLSRHTSRDPVARNRTFAALHGVGVVTIAFIWQHAGGLQNPALLVAFVLPVIGSIFLSRWQPYLMATLAVVLVALIASAQAPELRWHAAGPGGAADWLSALIGRAAAATTPPFASFYAPSAYFVALLEVFVIMLFACAVVAGYLGTFLERLQAQAAAYRAETVRSQALWTALVAGLPLPAVLLDAETREVLCVSTGAQAKFFSCDETVVGRDLFQVLNFSYPETIERLVSGADGAERLCMIRLRDTLVATEIRVQHVAHNGRRLALVLINDTTEALCVRSALDVDEHAAVVADSQGRVLALNKAARAIFSDAEVGADVSHLVTRADEEPRWWDPGLSGRRKLHVVIARRTYQVTSSAVPLPGEDTRLYVIALLPAPQVEAADQTSIGRTALARRS